ncbi:hypothetical protein L596_013981 [Steinernema carpocapsae]|uniref:G-protein coupled receptors family 1 profile domain-containing protein n=1 Tax=Steinernema carpocapsae TaxID=34508 RepID=A0A4U5NA09_STECR|nr:hypothetical protein L596_013981 [Steinernema carpocapsae]
MMPENVVVPWNTTTTFTPAEVRSMPYAEIFELFLDFVSPFINLYFLYLLKRPFVHLNLRILLAQLSLGFMGINVARILLIFYKKLFFLSDFAAMAIYIFHNGLVFGIMDVSILISCERLLATILSRKYEKLRTVWVTTLLAIGMFSLNVFFAYYIYRSVYLEEKIRPGLITLSKQADRIAFVLMAIMALNVVGLLIFVFVRRYNEKQWKEEMKTKLSHRYQIMENIRTSKQLLLLLLIDFFMYNKLLDQSLRRYYYFSSLYYFIVIFHSLFFYVNDKPASHHILSEIFDVLTALSCILLPLLFIRSHPRMWRTMKRHLRLPRKTRSISSISEDVKPQRTRSVINATTNVYFDELRKTWDQLQRK